MAPFDYSEADAKAAEEKTPVRAEDGEYQFKVDHIVFETFKANANGVRNKGWTLTLLVGALPGRDVKVFDRLVNTPKAIWRFLTFAHAVGLRSKDKPAGGWQESQFIGLMGRAKFKKNDRGYLEVDEYVDAGENAKPQAAPSSQPPKDEDPPPHTDADNLQF